MLFYEVRASELPLYDAPRVIIGLRGAPTNDQFGLSVSDNASQHRDEEANIAVTPASG